MNINIPEHLPEQVSALLDQIGEKLGVAAGYVWTVLLRQQMVEGLLRLAAVLLPVLLFVWAQRWLATLTAEHQQAVSDYETAKREHDEAAKEYLAQKAACLQAIEDEPEAAKALKMRWEMYLSRGGMPTWYETIPHLDRETVLLCQAGMAVAMVAGFYLLSCALPKLVNPAYYALQFVLRALR